MNGLLFIFMMLAIVKDMLMFCRTSIVIVAALILFTSACYSPVSREEWPVRDDPLFQSTVWIDVRGGLGSGVIVHSSKRGTYVLTAGHMTQDDDSFLRPEAVIDVGVFALSHASPIQKPYAMYQADVVTTTVPPAPADDDPTASFMAILKQVSGDDIAILRLRTDRRFVAAPLYSGEPVAVSGKPAILVPIVPKMHPHRKPASCDIEDVRCLTQTHGNSGAPVFVGGQVVGIASYLAWGPGPRKLQNFVRKHEEIGFLLGQPIPSD